jgi:hypothetical protein
VQEDKRKSKVSDNDKRDYNSSDGMPRIREEAVEDAKTEANKRGVCGGYRGVCGGYKGVCGDYEGVCGGSRGVCGGYRFTVDIHTHTR